MTRFTPWLAGALLLGSFTTAAACEPPAVYYDPLVISSASSSPEISRFISENAPVVQDVSLGRGTAAQSSLCGGQGYISFSIALPPGAPVTFDDIGLVLTVVEGSFPRYALPEGPIRSILGPREDFQHLGSWFEGPPSQHKTISAVVETAFVAPDGTRGKAARFTLFSEPERQEADEGQTR